MEVLTLAIMVAYLLSTSNPHVDRNNNDQKEIVKYDDWMNEKKSTYAFMQQCKNGLVPDYTVAFPSMMNSIFNVDESRFPSIVSTQTTEDSDEKIDTKNKEIVKYYRQSFEDFLGRCSMEVNPPKKFFRNICNYFVDIKILKPQEPCDNDIGEKTIHDTKTNSKKKFVGDEKCIEKQPNINLIPDILKAIEDQNIDGLKQLLIYAETTRDTSWKRFVWSKYNRYIVMNEEFTVLHKALDSSNFGIIKMLLDFGAQTDLCCRTSNGLVSNLLLNRKTRDNADLVKLLIKHGVCFDTLHIDQAQRMACWNVYKLFKGLQESNNTKGKEIGVDIFKNPIIEYRMKL
jgi:hypothetical protein